MEELINFNVEKYKTGKAFSPGTELWVMKGLRKDAKLSWKAISVQIKEYRDGYRPYYILSDGHNILPELIGKVYFLTEKEAIDRFNEAKNKIGVSIPKVTLEKVFSEDKNQLRDLEVCEFDSVSSTAVYLGGFRDLQKINDLLNWRNDKDIARQIGMDETKFLKLSDIYTQVRELFGRQRDDKVISPIITVIVTDPLKGAIYQCNNHGEGIWEKVGKTNGYA